MQLFTDDCLDPGFGHENKDGYVRICDKPRPHGGKLVMRHRWMWEQVMGPIPEGYEINHLCKNRRCCNVKHLECIDGREHAIKSNKERYEPEYQEFKKRYLSEPEIRGLTQYQLGHLFNRSQPGISKWMKRLNEEIICH